ncbi:MAG: response regulator [Desulfobacterium sp.]|nr:response regulator [Desulfobacterium sp.]
MMKPSRILLLDDEKMVVDNIQDLIELETDHKVFPETSPFDALVTLDKNKVDLIITDFLMPEMNGIDFLIQAQKKDSDSTSIILTGYADKENAIRAINEVGIYQYIEKPWNNDDLLITIQNAVERGNLITELKQQYNEIQQAYLEIIYRLTITAEYFEMNTYTHILRISHFSKKLAELSHKDETYCNNIKYASMMHDVGKIGIPKEILQKPGKLTKEEFEIVKKHPNIGGRILRNATNKLMEMAREISIFHHEKWNGKGYLQGILGDNIPESARIVAIADVFDALLSERPYKTAMAPERVKKIFQKDRGTHFDPGLTDLLLNNFDQFIDIYNKISTMDQEEVLSSLFKHNLP